MNTVDEAVHFVELLAQRRPDPTIRGLTAHRRTGTTALHQFDLARHIRNLKVQRHQECVRLRQARVIDHVAIVSPISNDRSPMA